MLIKKDVLVLNGQKLVQSKTAEEMADQFGFNADQREQMAELLADENNSLWSQVLYGISGGDGEIVTVELSQVGNIGGEPYWSWYGFNSRVVRLLRELVCQRVRLY